MASHRPPAVEQGAEGRSVSDAVHSLDDVALLRKIDEAATSAGRSIDVLIQADLAREPTKHGAAREDVMPILDAASPSCRADEGTDAVALPPASDDPEWPGPISQRTAIVA